MRYRRAPGRGGWFPAAAGLPVARPPPGTWPPRTTAAHHRSRHGATRPCSALPVRLLAAASLTGSRLAHSAVWGRVGSEVWLSPTRLSLALSSSSADAQKEVSEGFAVVETNYRVRWQLAVAFDWPNTDSQCLRRLAGVCIHIIGIAMLHPAPFCALRGHFAQPFCGHAHARDRDRGALVWHFGRADHYLPQATCPPAGRPPLAHCPGGSPHVFIL